MKIAKGQKDYLKELQKQKRGLACFQWVLALAFLILGMLLMENYINIFTILAIIFIFIAVKSSHIYGDYKTYKTMDNKYYRALKEKGDILTLIYHPIFQRKEKNTYLSAIVIFNNTILGFAENSSQDTEEICRYIRTILIKQRVETSNIKIFTEFKPFMDRVEGLHNMATISKKEISREEKKIRAIILHHSL